MSDQPERISNHYVNNYLRDAVTIPMAQKLLAMVILSYRNPHTLECFPSIDTLAVNLGVHRRKVQRLLSRLIEGKVLLTVKRHDRHNNYFFLRDLDLAVKILGNGAENRINRHLTMKAHRKRFVT